MGGFNQKIDAVHVRDLANLLDRLGVRDRFEKGEMRCKFCGNAVNKDNLHSIFPESGAVHVICDSPTCINSLMIYVEERKNRTSEGD